MSHVFFARELEGVATFWRIYRRDGFTLGFTSHDRDLSFDGVLHRAAPGMVPSAIRRTADLSPDSSEIEGVLTHESITEQDLVSGRYDKAAILVGVVDWETLDRASLYRGSLGSVSGEGGKFAAELISVKQALDRDYIPRTSPTCRAQFCGPGCTLSSARFSVDAKLTAFDPSTNSCSFDAIDPALFVGGQLWWIDGPHAGLESEIVGIGENGLVLDRLLPVDLAVGTRVRLREGCDHTLATCHNRFGNAVNFQGEPFLPGNDLLARYPLPQ